ncbi:MAG TPA: ATP-grasp domain-containing protein [Oceanospirillales bacterium]|nr:ATP-grasp domain-containing protein [Oceanospirillales bacterium]
MNKPSSMGSNGSKPYQAQLIQQAGIRIPETLITNNSQTAMKFINSYEKVIYKSISGVRSIVKAVNKKDMARLEQISSCPIQFQKFIKGIDVRVHIAGKDIHATAINSTRTDYRYPDDKNDSTPEMSIYKLDERTHKKCILLAQNLGLSLSGIDLKITTEGQAYCLEINPCPGFSHYELKTRQPIAKSIAKFLC